MLCKCPHCETAIDCRGMLERAFACPQCGGQFMPPTDANARDSRDPKTVASTTPPTPTSPTERYVRRRRQRTSFGAIVLVSVGLVCLLCIIGLGFRVLSRSVPALDMAGPAFDSDSLERTKKWAETKHRSLDEVRGNSFIYDEKRALMEKEVQSFVGRKVSWEIPVETVLGGTVVCSSAWWINERNGGKGNLYLVILDSPNKVWLYDDELSLSIGQEISEDRARTLMPGEVVTIESEIIEAEVDEHEVLIITLGKLHAS